jgi:hypothetical protein
MQQAVSAQCPHVKGYQMPRSNTTILRKSNPGFDFYSWSTESCYGQLYEKTSYPSWFNPSIGSAKSRDHLISAMMLPDRVTMIKAAVYCHFLRRIPTVKIRWTQCKFSRQLFSDFPRNLSSDWLRGVLQTIYLLFPGIEPHIFKQDNNNGKKQSQAN